MVVTAIDGMAGVGKTALAVHAAHRIAGHYPDGQLFIDLHGYTPGVKPIEPAEALDHALRALGIPGTQIPAGLDEKAGLYRSRLADQKTLIVLDNAATESQVTPLLPGGPGCLVLVTSRRRLAGLDHTHILSLDTLPTPDAVALFTQTARLTGESPEQLTELVELCGRLPLAIRIAAARLRSRPAWTLAHLVGRLRHRQHRLTELSAGQRSVTAALDLSYADLTSDQQRAYRLLGLHPGPDFDVAATAALLDSTLEHSGRVLDQLIDAHLLLEPVAGRYRFHDLTRAHAAGVATPDPAALDRLLDYYRHTASAAMDTAYPYERGRRPLLTPIQRPARDLPDPASAVGWLDTELPNLLATAINATALDRPTYILDLSTTLQRHLQVRGRYRDAETLHQHALTTARAIGHRVGELTALTGLGYIQRRLSRYEQATDHYQRAIHLARAASDRSGELEALIGLSVVYLHEARYEQATDHYQQAIHLARTTGDRSGERGALTGLGHVHRLQGRSEQATDHYQQALRIAQATGHRPGELTALTGLGDVHRLQSHYDLATHHYQRAIRLAQAIGHRLGEVNTLIGLGDVHRLQGRSEQAIEHYRQGLQIARAIGYRPGQGDALVGLAQVHRRHGRHQQAIEHLQEVLDLARESGDPNFEFEAQQGLGRLQYATGNPTAAIPHHQRALALADELGQPSDEARAHDGLAHAHHALNRHPRARHHWQLALDLLTGLGVDHTDEEETTVAAIRARLAGIDPGGSSGPTV
jgi:tetratricopeptide (TPR) repeat protein